MVDVELLPKVAGGAGVVGPVVLPAPPSVGAEVDEEVVVVVVAAPLVVGSVMLTFSEPHPTVTAPMPTTTPAPATAASTLSFRCCNFTSDPGPDPCSGADRQNGNGQTTTPPLEHSDECSPKVVTQVVDVMIAKRGYVSIWPYERIATGGDAIPLTYLTVMITEYRIAVCRC